MKFKYIIIKETLEVTVLIKIMYESKIFSCKMTNYQIKVSFNKANQCIIDDIESDYIYPKALAQLLRVTIDELKEKKIKEIYQIVDKNEWHDCLENKTTWEIIFDDIRNYRLLLKCDIGDFLHNYSIGVGWL